MRKITLFALALFAGFGAQAQGCDELFFSEYAEGSSNHKYLEIYNPTSGSISLSDYTIYQSGNGGSYTNTFTLYGTLAAHDVFVVAADQADASILAVADTALSYPSICHFNGDDAIILTYLTDTIDVIGVPGVDPGTEWTVGTGSTKDNTLVRKASVSEGSTDWTTGATEWDVYPQNTWTYVGAHTSNCSSAVSGCDELIFSEYAEGSSNHKYLEIYNPTGASIALSNYTVYQSGNGGSYTNTFALYGILASHDVFVLAADQADASILAIADTALSYPSVCHFNGDDAIILTYLTDTIDVIGVPGVDPGTEWTVGTGSTKDNTLVRKATVSEGSTDWTTGATEWDVYPQNTWTYGGAHTSNCAGTPNPTPTFSTVDLSDWTTVDADGVADSLGATGWVKVIVTSVDFDGNAGYSFTAEDATDGITIYKSSDVSGYTAPVMGDSLYVHGTVAQYNGLTELVPDSIYYVGGGYTLPAASVETTLDETTESELIQFIGMTLVDPTQWPTTPSSKNVDITNGVDTLTMRIDYDTDIDGTPAPTNTFDVTGVGQQYDSSNPYTSGYQIFPRELTDIYVYPVIPVYEISDVTGIDAMGLPDSANVMCKLEGIVMGVDMQGSATAVSFTLHDGVDGIGTYGSISNYTVTEGDSVRIIGSIGQYNGLLQMYLDSVVLISQGHALPTTATVITSMDETTESELIKFENATLVDPTQWGSGSSGYTCDITNGTDTITLRIDADTDLYGTPAPVGAFDVIGIGGQFTFNSPALDGYQLLPRYTADITAAAGVWVPELVVSEIMAGSNSTAYNADWFEIYNYGDSTIDLSGYSWDDESGIAGTVVFPSVTIAPGEAIVVLDDVAANKDAFLAEWKLYAGSVTIVANDEVTGSFPSLSQNGDGVYLFDPANNEISNSTYAAATAGFSVEFDTTGAFVGDAVDGQNGAYTSLEGDVASPGNLTPNSNVFESELAANIYPNPSKGEFTVEFATEQAYSIEIFAITGARIYTAEGKATSARVALEAAQGSYIMKIRTEVGTSEQIIILN